MGMTVVIRKVRFFDCFQPPEQFFSYPAAVTITGDRASNLDLCLALMCFFNMPHMLRH
jgi:hypothetical protein